MLSRRQIKFWYLAHKWSSLVCTAFLLLLCVTGLPLIFHHEIDHMMGNEVEPPVMASTTPKSSLDRVVRAARERYQQEFMQFLVWDRDEPNALHVVMAATPDAPPDDNHSLLVDARSAAVLQEPKDEGVMHVLFKLHVDLFAGLAGKLFLGAMGLLFVVSIVSGIVVYAPFMRRLAFGTVRKDRSPRLKWLDLHNLLGIVTLAWATVVGATGVINTWADLVIKLWQSDQLAAMVAPYRGQPVPRELGSLDHAVRVALETAPGMAPAFVAFPGSMFSSPHHYAVFLRGQTPLTARLLKPVLIDAQHGSLTDTRDLPWYVTALLVSQPLHFGDYGGMPLKVIWALLDIVTIVVLGSGLYLWAKRHRLPLEVRLAEIERAGGEVLSPDAAS